MEIRGGKLLAHKPNLACVGCIRFKNQNTPKKYIALKSGQISHASLDLKFLLENGNKFVGAAYGVSTPQFSTGTDIL